MSEKKSHSELDGEKWKDEKLSNNSDSNISSSPTGVLGLLKTHRWMIVIFVVLACLSGALVFVMIAGFVAQKFEISRLEQQSLNSSQ